MTTTPFETLQCQWPRKRRIPDEVEEYGEGVESVVRGLGPFPVFWSVCFFIALIAAR